MFRLHQGGRALLRQCFSSRVLRSGGCFSHSFVRLMSAERPEGVEDILMPALSPTMEQGNIASWELNIGDKIESGDVICQIETDKATVSLDSTEEGFLAAQFLPGGSEDIVVGTLIGLMVEEEEDLEAAKAYAATIDISALTSSPSPSSSPPPPASSSSSSSSDSTAAAAAAAAAESSSAVATDVPLTHYAHLTPAVWMLLSKEGLDPYSIVATGKGGRLLKGDVLSAMAAGTATQRSAGAVSAAADAAPGAAVAAAAVGGEAMAAVDRSRASRRTHTDIKMTNMRKVIAKRLQESKQTVPHSYSTVKCDMREVISMRKKLLELKGVKVTVNDFIVRASALACRDVPQVNSTFDDRANEVVRSPTVDISVAVATAEGLITPIVKQADTKSLSDISADVRALAGKAKAGTLAPDEFVGGSFTISNLGMFGVEHFKAVINKPQTCILAVSSTLEESRLSDEGVLFSVGNMAVTLSADERAVDNFVAAAWLKSFKGYIENPFMLA